jgi:hypothetical protein
MNSAKGIDYYNEDNKDNKEKEENEDIIAGAVAPCNGVNPLASPWSGCATEEEVAVPPVNPVMGLGSATAILDKSKVLRAAVQLFDNGPAEPQRYKLKVRLNLVDGTHVEFIAALTQRIQNFKKHIPQPYTDALIDAARMFREQIFRKYSVYPFLGKFHRNLGRSAKNTRNVKNIEPNTMAVVWFNTEDQHWTYTFQIHDLVIQGDLDETYVSAKQQQVGLLAKDLWTNGTVGDPYKEQRPLTYMEMMAQKNT